MANYYGVGRSNYVRVTDVEAFRDAAHRLQCEVVDNGDGFFALLDSNDDGAGFSFYDPIADVEHDPIKTLAPFLAEGEVMILMESGHEKHRYACGWAMAFNSKGEYRDLNLDHIYELAKSLGPNITRAEY